LRPDFGDRLLKRSGPQVSVAGLVAQAFEVWHNAAIEALEQAATAKGDKPGLPPLEGNAIEGYTAESISRRSTAESRLWNQDDAVRILQYYLEDQQQRTATWAESVFSRSLVGPQPWP
jgi:hypothetical protein